MGQRANKKFEKRFKGGIEIHFADQPLSPCEQEYRNACLRKAITEIFKAMLGREPTQEELLGLTKLEPQKRRKP